MTASETISLINMKHELCSLFHRSRGSMAKCISKQRKLILHFDVNKTIVPVDSATGETVEAALNVFLSGMAWGKDLAGEWHAKDQLSSAPLEVDDVSFYKFEEKRLLKEITRDRGALRYHLTSFTDRPQGSNFKPYLHTLLQSLKWNLPYDENVHKQMTVPGTKSCRFHFILPAFYNLLRHLVEEGREFAVVFRTYGSDAVSVLRSISCAINTQMPFCENLGHLSNDIANGVYALKRTPNLSDSFCIQFEKNDQKSSTSNINNGMPDTNGLCNEDMYNWLTSMTGINAIRDNVEDWYKNSFDSRKGKPLWIDHTDENSHHIFFDDNIRPGNMDSIVNLRLRDDITNNSGSFKDIARHEERMFEQTNMVPVNFPEAILDENYFIEKLNTCEENYSTRLRS